MLTMLHWPYLQIPAFSGNIKADITTLLRENGKEPTADHCIAVANTSRVLALRFGLEPSAAVEAALLHDSATIVRPEDMLAYASARHWQLDASEKSHPFLLHQRLSAVFAEKLFQVTNPIVLSAIACHTTLKAAPSAYDMVLFLADKLSWDPSGVPPFHSQVSEALETSLPQACLVYINFTLSNGMVLSPHQWLLAAKGWLEAHS